MGKCALAAEQDYFRHIFYLITLFYHNFNRTILTMKKIATKPEEAKELQTIAQEIKTWRESRPSQEGWTIKRLMSTFPGLGSDKTLAALSQGEFAGRPVWKWLPRYRVALGALRNMEEHQGGVEEILPLSNMAEALPAVCTAVLKMGKKRIDRLVVIEGGSGAGKTSNLKRIKEEWAGAAYYMEADSSWVSARQAAGDILAAMGETTIAYPRAKRQEALLSRLQSNVVLLIDEAHHGGAEFLSLVKTLINRSEAVIVLAAMDTLWRKLTCEASEEASQLLHNRLSEKVVLYPPEKEDVQVYFEAVFPVGLEHAEILAKESARYGYMSYLRKVMEQVLEQQKEGGSPDEILSKARKHAKAKMGVM